MAIRPSDQLARRRIQALNYHQRMRPNLFSICRAGIIMPRWPERIIAVRLQVDLDDLTGLALAHEFGIRRSDVPAHADIITDLDDSGAHKHRDSHDSFGHTLIATTGCRTIFAPGPPVRHSLGAKGSAGGRYIAMERGLRPGWCGWPFRGELRELAARSGGRRSGAAGRPWRRVGQPANPEADGATRGTRTRKGGRFRRKPGPVGLGERRFRSPDLSVDE